MYVCPLVMLPEAMPDVGLDLLGLVKGSVDSSSDEGEVG
jgi:hypothetical protein